MRERESGSNSENHGMKGSKMKIEDVVVLSGFVSYVSWYKNVGLLCA